MSITWLALALALLLVPSAARARTVGAGARRRPRLGADALPLALTLAATALRAGQPVHAALELAAPAADTATAAELRRVAALLQLGAGADEAWHGIPDSSPLAPLAIVACRSAASGARLAETLDHAASEHRDRRRADALAAARRAGVFAIAPLGLCFLPAFVCLGVVPLVVGIAGGVLPGLR